MQKNRFYALLILCAVLVWAFPAPAEELAVEGQLAKYIPYGEGSFILQGMARLSFVDPGGYTPVAFGGGLFYYVAKRYQIGIFIEGGEANYEAAIGGAGIIDENYITVRPSMSRFIDDHIELSFS